jgi:hypothetical protein
LFEALILVCSVSSIMEIDTSNCLIIKDSWGPYITQENCDIRTSQMVDDILNGELNYYIVSALGYPPFLYTDSHCGLVDKTI